tara:strand:+ start:483 stop:722 length:240 start_codon:yes stop_codon:yes gene_type:complete
MDMNEETKKLNDLSNKYEAAKSSYFSDLERDVNRQDGSARQDALHDQYMEESRARYRTAESAFEAQVKLVASLLEKKNT